MAKAVAKSQVLEGEVLGLDVDQLTSMDNVKYNFRELNNTEAEKNIREIASSAKNTKVLIQETLVGVLMHFVRHGDYTKLSALVDIVPTVQRSLGGSAAGAIIRFVETFSTLRYVREEKKFTKVSKTAPNAFCGQTKPKNDDNWHFDVEAMQSYETKDGVKFGNFFDVGRAAAMPQGVDFLKTLVNLANAARRLNEERTLGKTVTTGAGDKRVKHEDQKIKHVNIDDQMVDAVDKFVRAHGVAWDEETRKYIAAPAPKPQLIKRNRPAAKPVENTANQ